MFVAKKDGSAASFVVVDMADMKASNHPNGCLIANSLGSCVAVAIYDPDARVGGVLNYVLPDSHLSREKAMANPFMFADTGIPLLFRRAYKLGAAKERIIVKVAGAANVINPDKGLNLGCRNCEALNSIMSKNQVSVHGQYLGGYTSLSLKFFMDNGRVIVETTQGKEVEI